MTDFLSKKERSIRMAAIRGRNNKTTELLLIKVFRQGGIKGWRRHYQVRGKPDFVFPREKVAVFVDGCFWHGCPKHFRQPGSNVSFWKGKIETNRRRDRSVDRELRKSGWKVIRIWEHSLRKPNMVVKRVLRALEG